MQVSTTIQEMSKHDILTQLAGPEIVSLRDAMSLITDPRKPRGIRHSFTDLLTICAAAMMAGVYGIKTIHEWAVNAAALLAAHQIAVPSLSTIQRVLTLIPAELFDAATTGWARQHVIQSEGGGPVVITVDGKAVRGSGTDTRTQTFLFAAIDQTHSVTLAQTRIPDKTNEIPYFQPLLDEFTSLDGVVVTADALHTQRAHAEYLHDRGAVYVLTVKGNQPTLWSQCASMNWRHTPVKFQERDASHGKHVTRSVKILPIPKRVDFPYATYVLQMMRSTEAREGKDAKSEIVYVVTSVPKRLARAAWIAGWVRKHWHIENRLHWVRDVTFAEDKSRICTGSSPQVMASLRNAAIASHRLGGATNLAESLRYAGARPSRALGRVI